MPDSFLVSTDLDGEMLHRLINITTVTDSSGKESKSGRLKLLKPGQYKFVNISYTSWLEFKRLNHTNEGRPSRAGYTAVKDQDASQPNLDA